MTCMFDRTQQDWLWAACYNPLSGCDIVTAWVMAQLFRKTRVEIPLPTGSIKLSHFDCSQPEALHQATSPRRPHLSFLLQNSLIRFYTYSSFPTNAVSLGWQCTLKVDRASLSSIPSEQTCFTLLELGGWDSSVISGMKKNLPYLLGNVLLRWDEKKRKTVYIWEMDIFYLLEMTAYYWCSSTHASLKLKQLARTVAYIIIHKQFMCCRAK